MQRTVQKKQKRSNGSKSQSPLLGIKSPKLSSNLITDGVAAESNALLRLPRSVSNIMPDRYYTRLRYYGSQNLTIAAGAAGVARRWQPSGAYDIDPLLGSTATPGFAEFAAFYDQYRVTVSRIRVEISNTSTTPCQATVVPLNADPGASPTLNTIQSWPNQSYAKVVQVPGIGAPPVRMDCEMSTEKIFGSKQVYFDDNFMSLTNTVPTNNWFWAVGLATNAFVGSATTYDVAIYIDIGCEFFARKQLFN